jgi:hypothetical protein
MTGLPDKGRPAQTQLTRCLQKSVSDYHLLAVVVV